MEETVLSGKESVTPLESTPLSGNLSDDRNLGSSQDSNEQSNTAEESSSEEQNERSTSDTSSAEASASISDPSIFGFTFDSSDIPALDLKAEFQLTMSAAASAFVPAWAKALTQEVQSISSAFRAMAEKKFSSFIALGLITIRVLIKSLSKKP